jgi:MerR family transcriptional regulator/heat shock protein HspR
MARRSRTKGAYTISVVAEQFDIHPQTLRLYEREGLLKPSRTEGNTRMYTDSDMERLEVILSLTRDLGVNLAGVEIILNMRVKMEEMQAQMRQFVGYVNENLGSIPKDGEDHLGMALVRVGSRAPVPAPAPAGKRAAKRVIKHTP